MSNGESVLSATNLTITAPPPPPPGQPQMHDIGIQCCFDPICRKTVETQAVHTDNAWNSVSERTSTELPLPGQVEASVPIEAEESKVKYDQSHAQ